MAEVDNEPVVVRYKDLERRTWGGRGVRAATGLVLRR